MNNKEILVIDSNREFSNTVLQLISKAFELAVQAQAKVDYLFLGKLTDVERSDVDKSGVSFCFEVERAKNFSFIELCDISEKCIIDRKPELVIMSSSNLGKDMASVLATRFEVGLVADCIDIQYNSLEGFSFWRSALCSSVIAKINCINCSFGMCTVKDNTFTACEHQRLEPMRNSLISTNIELSSNVLTEECLRKEEISLVYEEDIHNFNRVFCIGRGVKNKETIDAIFRIASMFDACVVGTRPMVEAGVINKSRQVGQSGNSISPNLYVGFGVSGASQHLVGMKNAKQIIAINRDANAPIFDVADYAIVANVEDIVEELLKGVKL